MKKPVKWFRRAAAGSILILLVMAALVMDGADGDSPATKASPEERDGKKVPVALTASRMQTFEKVVRTQGTVEARHRALVPVRIPGTIQALFVDEGDPVIQGRTALFQIDNIRQQQAVDSARQGLEVARSAQKEREALLDQNRVVVEKAHKDFERFKILLKKKSISPDQFERQEAAYLQAEAGRKHSQALVDLSRQQARQAEIALAMARKDLADTQIAAPISGVISKKFLELGEMGPAGAPVFRIEDPSQLEISVFVPAEYWPEIRVSQTRARLFSRGKAAGTLLTVSYRAPTIDDRMRTVEVKCRVPEKAADLCPGQMVDLELILEQHAAVGVPAEALLKQNRGWRIFTVESGRACLIEVEPGLETAGWIEIKNKAIAAGAPVVSMGQFLRNDRALVEVLD